MAADDPAARFALYQIMDRVIDRFSPQSCQSLVSAIIQRPDSLEKVHRLQAVERITIGLIRAAVKDHESVVAARAKVWATSIHAEVREVWRRLYGKRPLPAPDENEVLVGFIHDAELMGILGLQAGWTPDLKRIDPDLDLPETDFGSLS